MGKHKGSRKARLRVGAADRAGATGAPQQLQLQAALQRGMSLYQAGRLLEAEKVFQQILAVDQRNVEVLQMLGVILLRIGKPQKGEALIRKAIKHSPETSQLHHNLGNIYEAQGKISRAVGSFQKASKLEPKNEWIHNDLGLALLQSGQINKAITTLQKAQKLNPGNPSVLCNLGLAYWRMEKIDAAIKVLEQAIGIDPKQLEALSNLGGVYFAKGELDKAEDALNKALKINTCSPDLFHNLGEVLTEAADEEAAVVAFHQALEINPNHVNALLGLGNVLITLGQFDKAQECYHKVQEIIPDNLSARIGLLRINPPDALSNEPREMEQLYTRLKAANNDKCHMAFALARIFEKNAQYSRAFNYLMDGNRIKREQFDYNLAEEKLFWERIKENFDATFFQERREYGVKDQTPIFILGMPRSGTTLTEQILTTHPQVFGAGELNHLKQLIIEKSLPAKYTDFPKQLRQLSGDVCQQLGLEYLDKLKEHAGPAANSVTNITDKMPHNFLHVGVIRLILPHAKIIHCTRNPLDNCLSIFKQNFGGFHKYACDLAELGEYYLLYQELMKHWHEVLPGFIFDFKYEDIVADQEGMTKRLLGFCALPWDDNCLQFHKTKRAIKTASVAQVRKEIYSDSVDLWQHYEQQLKPLIEALSKTT